VVREEVEAVDGGADHAHTPSVPAASRGI
jgi:hypothetical protein